MPSFGFSPCLVVSLGLAAAFAGKWLEEAGPRKVGMVAALCWGGAI